ncbi:MAG: T9SS type A sorting domain-containing protein, partial [Flammeovirgaceae bacterium]
INTSHPYLNGFGLNNNSNYSYTMIKPITVSGNNPNIFLTEVLIAEYAGSGVKDFAVIEGSKDNGINWLPITETYSSNVYNEWRQAFDAKANPNSTLLKNRLFSITGNGNFKAGDNILIRFRLFADAVNNGWGWAIDNLNIQTPITELEKRVTESSLSIYPNPSAFEKVTISLETLNDDPVAIEVFSARGAMQQQFHIQPINHKAELELSIADWSGGLYILKANVGGNSVTKKFVVQR